MDVCRVKRGFYLVEGLSRTHDFSDAEDLEDLECYKGKTTLEAVERYKYWEGLPYATKQEVEDGYLETLKACGNAFAGSNALQFYLETLLSNNLITPQQAKAYRRTVIG